ncbi:Uu.00g087200.m01.CDS01 [Anthostomella pinea]|uniref:Arginine biosynthesis bifunctional protein ArgJ, mitochondrial n=1 Tax=Anthostomella pinea TaxID=933095 RepID=A0AAI8VMB3_9PEZI|nr:Uu.00g087200.m01.CDS01 [Anthostomella pinea]
MGTGLGTLCTSPRAEGEQANARDDDDDDGGNGEPGCSVEGGYSRDAGGYGPLHQSQPRSPRHVPLRQVPMSHTKMETDTATRRRRSKFFHQDDAVMALGGSGDGRNSTTFIMPGERSLGMSLPRTSCSRVATLASRSISGSRWYSAPAGGIPAAKKKYIPASGTYPKGFKVSGTWVGVKPSNKSKPDLALIASDTPCSAAAVFTKIKYHAAPVTFSRRLLQDQKNSGFRCVIINSGCANAATGQGALEDAREMSKAADRCLDAENATVVMSTGVIGQRLPIKKILDKVPEAHEALGDSHKHWMACATAICTTDTFPKVVSKTFKLPSSPDIQYRIAGMTKGAGMIHPNMATLLGVISTDASVSSSVIPEALKYAVDRSFNSITIDGDTSTNDTIALLANGAAGGKELSSTDTVDYQVFLEVLTETATDLAKLVVRDGEGATKFVTIRVEEAPTDEAARLVASVIARSPLVKTALYGRDANWGRIYAAIGTALTTNQREPAVDNYADVEPEKTNISFIPADGSPELKVFVDGEPGNVDEARCAEVLAHEDIEVLVRLGAPQNKKTMYWTCDYSHEYITINADYRS